MNKFITIAHLGYDPDAINNGCKMKVAVDVWNGREKKTIWLKVFAFGQSGINCLNHKKKGDKILIEGRVDVSNNNEFIIVTDNIQFL